ncbi:hypothetical protein Golob_003482 [Gossypium lobatum]|uniref:Uncharacterized protein n=1 Tax=Gossypium lobatum TaxID=34289 RepID=A0A7J8MYN4_9ROSI|nr:hypothetical protein [Gossypium lobatum]
MAFLVVSCIHVYNKWFATTGNRHELVEYCVVCLSMVSNGEELRVNVAPYRSFIISSMVSLAKRVGEWIENPLSSELTVAFCSLSTTVLCGNLPQMIAILSNQQEVGLASIHDSVEEFVAHMLIDQQDELRRRVLGMLWGIWYSWNVLVWKPISLSVLCPRAEGGGVC